MDKPRHEKVAVVDEVRQRLSGAEAAVLTEYRGLDVPAMAALRAALREAGGEYKVYKNTLVRFAVNDLGLDLLDLLTGPTAIAFVGEKPDGSPGDAVSLARALAEFGKSHDSLVIKGGLLDSERLTAEQVQALAKIAPREVLLAQLAGALAAPLQQFAGLLNALPQNLAYALKALIDQGGGPEAAGDTGDAEVAEEAAGDTGDAEVAEEAAEDTGDAEAVAEAAEDTGDAEAVAETAEDTGDAEAVAETADDKGAAADEAGADTETASAEDTEEA